MRNLLLTSMILLVSPVGFGGTDEPLDRFFSAYRSGTADEMAQLYTEDAVFRDVSQRHHVEGRAALREMLAKLKDMHLEMQIEEKRRVADGNRVVLEILYRGTLDCAKLGRPDHPNLSYSLPAVLILELEEGRIASQTDYIDFATFSELFAQLGVPAQ